MKCSVVLLVLFLFAPLTHAQPAPPEVCINNAYGAIADFENYVDPGNNANAKWVMTRCSRHGDNIYRMELVANCNDNDSSTYNTITITSASNEPFEKCTIGPNKNAKCNEMIPGARDSIAVSTEESAAWEEELRAICEFYIYTPPAQP